MFRIAHVHIYVPYFPHGWKNLRQDVFWKRTKNSGERQSNDHDSKEQQPQRASLLGIGDGASLALPLLRWKACSHSHYTRPETAMQQSHSGYIKHGTMGIMKVVQLQAGKFYTNSCVCIKLYPIKVSQ